MNSLREILISDISFRTSRSSGSGGQNVNKVESKVEASINILENTHFSVNQKSLICSRLKNRIDKHGNLSVTSSTSRYQKQNKKFAISRLLDLIELALKKKKIRKKTGVPKSVKAKRLKKKKQRSEIKSNRKFRPEE